MIAAWVAGAVAALSVATYYFLTAHFNHWKERGVLGPKPVLFFGTIKNLVLRRTPLNLFYVDDYNNYPKEKYVGVFRFRQPALLVRDPDIVKRIMIKDFDNFMQRGIELSDKGIGMNIFHASADDWQVLRSKFTPTFTSGKLKEMFHLLNTCGDKFVDYMTEILAKNQEIDTNFYIKKYTKSGISSCAFGLDLDFRKGEIFDELQKIDDIVLNNTYMNDLEWMFPGILRKLNMDFFPSLVSDFFCNLVRDIFENRKGVPSSRKDFMDMFMEVKNSGGVMQGAKRGDKAEVLQIDDRIIAAQAALMYVAGFETSASTMSYLLHELAHHPEIQERLLAEINHVIQRHGALSYEAIQEMTYLSQVLNETLRKYPVVDPLTRVAKEDYRVPDSDLVVSKGTSFIISVRAIHYDEKYYPDPTRFDPERFLPENVKNRHSAVHLPFGIGPRNCIGLRFAQVTSRLCLAKLLPKFRVEPAATTAYNIQYDPQSILLNPVRGIPLKFVPR